MKFEFADLKAWPGRDALGPIFVFSCGPVYHEDFPDDKMTTKLYRLGLEEATELRNILDEFLSESAA